NVYGALWHLHAFPTRRSSDLVSPYHKKRNWQIMITGIWIGAIIGYIILIFMYGRMYEQTLTDQVRMQTEISELERQNKALLEDKEDLEEKSSPDVLSVS